MKKLLIIILIAPIFCFAQKDSTTINFGVGFNSNFIKPIMTENENNSVVFPSYGVYCFANYSFKRIMFNLSGGYSVFSRIRELNYAQYKQNGSASNIDLLTAIKLSGQKIKLFGTSGVRASFFNYNNAKQSVSILSEDEIQNNTVFNIPIGLIIQKNNFFAQMNYLLPTQKSNNNLFFEFKLAYAFINL